MVSTQRPPPPERPPPPVPASASVPAPAKPPPLETPPPPSPSSQAGDEYHTPPPSLDASPREEPGGFPRDGRGEGARAAAPPTRSPTPHASPPREEPGGFPRDVRGEGARAATPSTRSPPLHASPPREEAAGLPSGGRGEAGAPAKSPQLSPVRLPAPHLLPPPASPSPSGRNGHEAAAAPARPPQLRLATGLVRTPSQGSLATRSPSPSPSPSPTPPSPLTPAPAGNRSGHGPPKQRAEAWKPPPSPGIAAPHFNPAVEAVTSPLRLGNAHHLDHHNQQQQQHAAAAAAAENGGAVPPDVAAVAAVGERRELSVTLRLATAVLSLAAFSVIASARTSGWAGDSYARHQQYRYAVAVNVIVCAYSIAQSFVEIRRLIAPRFIFRSMSSYYCSLFLDQVLAYLLMSASSAAASRNDLWVSRFGTDAFNRKISSALWLSFIAFLMLALNALISTANLFSMV
ncbi:CASP-like protein 4U1 [Panicum virgatum]|uniref:CASP-like protein n=1 Tax=Panicum virgatum TaxID=38727 RepID=A0A8T0ST17_PANVG|nr:CASP-like protein 4U1 [Panicum virgatum]XP_039851498.1 CASP-like protein 4U1 [Panicum virgatum]KAG2599396.1 hypothetical protein PVAP13_5KG453600 [Panicum virgatum]